MIDVDLWPGLPGGHWARLRELSGADEASVGSLRSLGSIAAVELLDRLLVATPGTSIGPGRAAQLILSDRDRLLAAIYRDTFGTTIESTTTCVACGEGFDLTFNLAMLVSSSPGVAASGLDESGVLTLADGRRVRLPNLMDELAIRSQQGAAAAVCLVERLMVEGDPTIGPEAVLEAVEAASPIAEHDLLADCPECEVRQTIHFALQSFLLAALRREGEWLAREVHRLAVTYHWPLNEILALPRSQRRRFIALIERDAEARRRIRR